MESGDKEGPSLVFMSMPEAGVHAPWCFAVDRSRHPKSDIAIVHEGPCLPDEPNAIQAPPAATTARPQNATEPAEPTRRRVQPRPQDPAPQEAETTDGSAAVDWLLNRRR